MADYCESCLRQGYVDAEDNFNTWWNESKKECRRQGISYYEAREIFETEWYGLIGEEV